jgi:hypothetical protein
MTQIKQIYTAGISLICVICVLLTCNHENGTQMTQIKTDLHSGNQPDLCHLRAINL